MLKGTRLDGAGDLRSVGEVVGVAAAAEIEDEDNGGCTSLRKIWQQYIVVVINCMIRNLFILNIPNHILHVIVVNAGLIQTQKLLVT